MIQKIKQLLIIAIAGLGLLGPGILTPVLSGVASADITANLCSGSTAASDPTSNPANCQSKNSDPSAGLTNLAKSITKWFSIIVGAVSIIMIIYGGFRYITSGGDSGRVGNAKNTLIYAIIGLIVVALAQLIVNVVLTQANNTTSNFQ